eukprot:TRINITY_DN25826_c0_g1_i2.p1 TRINITY_DN25826_c0_g1~~TRINITY_DN25826_c0_g1_i2.p1  ORF type:complete len:231 (+),score=35.36 TRINITY_DN25826_c0_g1_i2:80-694(+)
MAAPVVVARRVGARLYPRAVAKHSRSMLAASQPIMPVAHQNFLGGHAAGCCEFDRFVAQLREAFKEQIRTKEMVAAALGQFKYDASKLNTGELAETTKRTNVLADEEDFSVVLVRWSSDPTGSASEVGLKNDETAWVRVLSGALELTRAVSDSSARLCVELRKGCVFTDQQESTLMAQEGDEAVSLHVVAPQFARSALQTRAAE